jgi:hypothetical protein
LDLSNNNKIGRSNNGGIESLLELNKLRAFDFRGLRNLSVMERERILPLLRDSSRSSAWFENQCVTVESELEIVARSVHVEHTTGCVRCLTVIELHSFSLKVASQLKKRKLTGAEVEQLAKDWITTMQIIRDFVVLFQHPDFRV